MGKWLELDLLQRSKLYVYIVHSIGISLLFVLKLCLLSYVP